MIYKAGNSYYRMLRPVGHLRGEDWRYYALWQPVVRVKVLWWTLYLWNFSREPFLLDMMGFEVVS